ncbi:hypothetical protein [Nonomuraea sp. NPDC049784]|uniref:hypothetical protein n=1 Tax=Nonomuraea sp. NPDC049784 TaxID=3154361 RepID=UPI0034030FCD
MRGSTALAAPALTAACSAQADDHVLRDPSKWPLAGLSGATATKEKLPEDAERALARLREGDVDGISQAGQHDNGVLAGHFDGGVTPAAHGWIE